MPLAARRHARSAVEPVRRRKRQHTRAAYAARKIRAHAALQPLMMLSAEFSSFRAAVCYAVALLLPLMARRRCR